MSEPRKEQSGEVRVNNSAGPAMPLMMVSAGDEVVLARVTGGKPLLLRLAEMGLRPGARFSVVSKGSPGPFIIIVMGTRLVVGQGMAHRMFVRPAQGQGSV